MVGAKNKKYKFGYKNILASLESLHSDHMLRFFCLFLLIHLS